MLVSALSIPARHSRRKLCATLFDCRPRAETDPMEAQNEASQFHAYVLALADPRTHPRLPARGRMGGAGVWRCGRLPAAGASNRLVRFVAKPAGRGPRPLRDQAEHRRAAWLGRAGRPTPRDADAPRPFAAGSTEGAVRPGIRGTPV